LSNHGVKSGRPVFSSGDNKLFHIEDLEMIGYVMGVPYKVMDSGSLLV
jgi:hypothetical protein